MTGPQSDLRRQLRAARRALTDAEQVAATEAVARTLGVLIEHPPPLVAAYVATDGELSLAPTIASLRDAGTTVVYPRIAAATMTFHTVGDEAELVRGAWDLMEPASSAPTVAPANLDLVLAPLVGFDDACHRIGRGKGYYDHAFAFLIDDPRPVRPRLVGIAHDVQRCPALPAEPHDVVLDAVVTPTTVYGSITG